MPPSRNKTFPRHQKKERWRTNNDKTNARYESKDVRTKQKYNRGTTLERSHYENTPIQIYWKFHHQKIESFQIKNSDIFHISVQNIDYGYSLEPPLQGGSNEYSQSMF